MTVSTSTSSVVYRGNGAATTYAVPFKVLDEDHLQVTRRIFATGVLDHTYVGTDYSYSGLGDDSGTLTLAGTALDDDYELVIERIVPYTQDLDIVNAGGFYPETVEEQLDLTVMGIQQLADLAGRGAIVPVGESGLELPKASDRAGKFFAFDAEGDLTMASGTGGDSALRTDLTDPDNALVGWAQDMTDAVTRSIRDKLRSELPSSSFDFGATGDNSADDTVEVAALATAVNLLCDNVTGAVAASFRPSVAFPPCKGFRSTVGVTLNALADIDMQSPLWLVAGASSATVGLWYKDYKGTTLDGPRDANCVFDIRRVTLSDWGSESDIGLKVDSAYVCNIRINRVDGFAVGLEGAFGYGRLELGDFRQNKIGLLLHAIDTPEQFTNQLRVVGGAFANDGANNGVARYGIVVRGSVNGLNSVVFEGQSYELNKVGAGTEDSIPILLDGDDGPLLSVNFFNQRMEGCGTTGVKATGDVRECTVTFLDAELEYTNPSSLLLDDQTTAGGAITVYRTNGATAPHWHPFFETGPLNRKAIQFTGPLMSIMNMESATDVGNVAAGPQTYAATGGARTFNAAGEMATSGVLWGVRVKLNGERAIAISGTKAAGDPADMVVICLDSAGAHLTSTGTLRVGQTNVVAATTSYGGHFAFGLNPANASTGFDGILMFSSSVDTVFIAMNSPCSGFSLKRRYGKARWFSSTSHAVDQYVASAIPIAFTNVQYVRGTRVLNSAPAAAGTEGWILVDQPAAGAAGTWKTFGVIAA